MSQECRQSVADEAVFTDKCLSEVQFAQRGLMDAAHPDVGSAQAGGVGRKIIWLVL